MGEHPVVVGHGVNLAVSGKRCNFIYGQIFDFLKGPKFICIRLDGKSFLRIDREKSDAKIILVVDRFSALKHYVFNCFRYDKGLLWGNILLINNRRIWRRNI